MNLKSSCFFEVIVVDDDYDDDSFGDYKWMN